MLNGLENGLENGVNINDQNINKVKANKQIKKKVMETEVNPC